MTLLDSPLFPPSDRAPVPDRRGDARDGRVYRITPDAELRVNVALATGRPLLVRGEPGTGKSSLAAYVARTLRWRYQEVVVTSRTEARDLLWQYATLARLNDAQANKAEDAAHYVLPQALWWAIDPDRAASYGVRQRKHPFEAGGDPLWTVGPEARDVVLIDEIDKADAEVPNDLLVAIGSLRFTVAETGDTIVGGSTPLLVFTTNSERDLPRAFVRRCVTVTLETPGRDELREIGKRHFPELADEVLDAVTDRLEHLRTVAEQANLRRPSIAEYLDTLAACEQLNVTRRSPAWRALTQATLWKHVRPPEGEEPPPREEPRA